MTICSTWNISPEGGGRPTFRGKYSPENENSVSIWGAPCLPGFGMSLPCLAEAPSEAEGEAEGWDPARRHQLRLTPG